MIAAMGAQQQAISQAAQARAEMLKTAAGMAPAQFTPDIWGQAGAYGTAKDTAYLNAENAKRLQEAVDPLGAKIRQNTEQMTANITDPATLQKLSQQQFAQRTLPGMYETGLAPQSTIYGSALFDKNTLAGIQLQQSLAQLGKPYENLPQTGLSPSITASAPMQAQAQNVAQQNAFLQGILGGGAGLQQSYEQGQNSLYNTLGQDLQTMQANQLAAEQANQKASTTQTGNWISGIGSLAGGILGSAVMPGLGTMAGAYLGKLGGGLAGGQSLGQSSGFGG